MTEKRLKELTAGLSLRSLHSAGLQPHEPPNRRQLYKQPRTEFYAAEPCCPLAGSPFYGDHLQGLDGSDGGFGDHMRGLSGVWIEVPKEDGFSGSHERGYTSEDGSFHLRGNAADW